jgi:1,4-alpha-glucan branching enzyme
VWKWRLCRHALQSKCGNASGEVRRKATIRSVYDELNGGKSANGKKNNRTMKTTKRTLKSVPAALPTSGRKVRLQYRAPEAKRVCVAGTFNNWKPDAAPMQPQAEGLWSIELELPPGTYEYRFVVDGDCWCSDPNATDAVLNPFGDYNAVLRVAAPT